jgi:putative Mn2+ efflux pump MntP
LVGTSILYPTLIIGFVAASMTILGLIFGQRLGLRFGRAAGVQRLGLRFGRAAGVFGGLILIALAVKAVLP